MTRHPYPSSAGGNNLVIAGTGEQPVLEASAAAVGNFPRKATAFHHIEIEVEDTGRKTLVGKGSLGDGSGV